MHAYNTMPSQVWSLGQPMPNFTLEGHDKGVNCLDYFSGTGLLCVCACTRTHTCVCAHTFLHTQTHSCTHTLMHTHTHTHKHTHTHTCTNLHTRPTNELVYYICFSAQYSISVARLSPGMFRLCSSSQFSSVVEGNF